MELRGIEEVTNILNEFLEPFGLTAVFDSEFACYPALNEIHYTVASDVLAEALYNEFVHELRPELDCDNWFILSLFHEIGHCETRDELSTGTYIRCQLLKAAIEEIGETHEILAHRRYFRLPDEKRATEWGLDYILDHLDEINALWDRLHAAIMKFYELNNVELD